MAKKSFKSGLNDLFKDNFNNEEEKNDQTSNVENLDDEQIQHLILKIQRYEKELHLWRTGKLTPEKFRKSLEDFGLTYDEKKNLIVKR